MPFTVDHKERSRCTIIEVKGDDRMELYHKRLGSTMIKISDDKVERTIEISDFSRSFQFVTITTTELPHREPHGPEDNYARNPPDSGSEQAVRRQVDLVDPRSKTLVDQAFEGDMYDDDAPTHHRKKRAISPDSVECLD